MMWFLTGKTIQKIVTIPAGIQRIANPCPRVEHPSWLQRSINERASGRKQVSILSALNSMKISAEAAKQAAAAATATETAAPRMLSEGSATGRPIKSILAGDGAVAEDGAKQKKRVRIQLEGEPNPDGLLSDGGAGAAGAGKLRTSLLAPVVCAEHIELARRALHMLRVSCLTLSFY